DRRRRADEVGCQLQWGADAIRSHALGIRQRPARVAGLSARLIPAAARFTAATGVERCDEGDIDSGRFGLDRYRAIRYCTDIDKLYRYRTHTTTRSRTMDPHVFLTHQAVRSLDGLTAFSALPDAPVLPYKERRRWLPRGVGALRARR